MSSRRFAAALFVVGELLSEPAPANAASLYTFARVASSTDFASLSERPAINNSGAVAFYGLPSPTAPNPTAGYYLADGGTTQLAAAAPLGTVSETPSFGDSGAILFRRSSPPPEALIVASGSDSNALYDTTGSILQFSALPQINSTGQVAFLGSIAGIGNGVFRGSGGPLMPIALDSTDPQPVFDTYGDPAMNDSGLVVFAACTSLGCQSAPGAQGIFRGDGLTVSAMLPSPSDFNFVAQLQSLNNAGAVAFYASLTSTGQQGIFTTDGAAVLAIALSGGDFFPDSGSFAINDQGIVVFRASLDSGGDGLFFGPDSVGDRIIGTGDSLLGSTVSSVAFWREGLNDHGQVAFFARLTDGSSGIFVATPVPEPPLLSALLAAAAFLGICRGTVAPMARGVSH
jgi:hypothetical protein